MSINNNFSLGLRLEQKELKSSDLVVEFRARGTIYACSVEVGQHLNVVGVSLMTDVGWASAGGIPSICETLASNL